MTDPDSRPTRLEIDAAGLPVEEATRRISRTLLDAIDRRRPFVALVRMPPAPPRGAGLGDVAERVRTLKLLRPGLRAWCRGLAFVTTEETLTRKASAIRSGDRLWGCPTVTTTDAASARAWVDARAGVANDGEASR